MLQSRFTNTSIVQLADPNKSYLLFMDARLAQLVEQWTVMRQVPGSIPTPNSTWLGVDSALHPTVGS